MFLCLCGAGLKFLVAVCVGEPSPSLPGVRWPLACVHRAGVAGSHGCGRVSSPFRGLRRLAPVRPSVSVPCFGVVVCCGVPGCVVPCFAVLCRVGLCCGVVRSALSCCAAQCPAVVCPAVAQLAAPCCAASRRVVLWCVASWDALSWCVARQCAAVRCARLLRVVPCIAVPGCLVGPFHCRSGVGWGRCWFDWPASWCGMPAEVMWLPGGWGARCGVAWLVGSVLRGSGCAARVLGSGGRPRGCPPWGAVHWSRVLWGLLPLVLGVAAVFSSCSGACMVALAVAGVVVRR